MRTVNRSKEERETGIIFNEQDSEAILWSVSPVTTRQMTRKLGPGVSVRGSACMEWKFPKKWVRIVKPRTLTPEQRKAASDRLRRVRNAP